MKGRSRETAAAAATQGDAASAGPNSNAAQEDGSARPALSRRQLLGGFGVGAVVGGAAAGGGIGLAARSGTAARGGGTGEVTRIVPFYGPHQGGIATPVQDRLTFGSLNLVAGSTRSDVRDLLREWTTAAAKMTRGELVGEVREPFAPPVDTGEAVGSPVSRLTITLGYGPSLFDGRFGLAARKPAALAALPPLPNEELDASYSDGDLCIQACSDDPLVAFHAVRNLARLGIGVVEHRWMELGFGQTSSTSTTGMTPRNLLGFKDGTRNIKTEQASLMNQQVWVGTETDQPWLRGGSYLVTRKIRIFIENWDRDYLEDQQNTIGRAKVTGAPLSGGTEFTAPDLRVRYEDGTFRIPANSHIRLASFESNGGTRILRRGYSFTDGIDPQTGTLLGGLFFIAFMKDPGQFVRLQRNLAYDALNEYTQHVGSAVFACPPGIRQGQHWGDGLFS